MNHNCKPNKKKDVGVKVSDADACREECALANDCSAYTFYGGSKPPRKKNCWMKMGEACTLLKTKKKMLPTECGFISGRIQSPVVRLRLRPLPRPRRSLRL